MLAAFRPAVLIAALFASTSCRTTTDMRLPFGAQLYTVRADMAREPLASINRVGALGYESVELAGFHGVDPAVLCREIQAAEMSVVASHLDWQLLRDDPKAAIAQTRAACSPTLILAWLPEEERRTLAQWQWWIGHLNAIAEMAREQGVAVAYHAHDFEFVEVDGVRPIDLLMQGLDARIGFELDTYWLAKAGADPVGFMRRYPGRVTHLHLKDIGETKGAMADVGGGRLDFPAIIAEARRQGVRHFIVERDDAPNPWASLAASLDYLRAMPLQR